MKYYKVAAEQGNIHILNYIGFLYEHGRVVKQDYQEAIKWYQEAAEKGNANAQINIGRLYEYGRGTKKDYHEAMKWYKKAADQGNSYAQNHIGFLYEHENSIKNYQEAMRWYQKAEEQRIDNVYEDKILSFCQAFTETNGSRYSDIHCVPNIPAKKLRNALKTYGASHGIQSGDVLVLYDDTVFGSAKKGFLLTADYLICNAGCFLLDDCEEVISVGSSMEVILMPQDVVIAAMVRNDRTMFIQWFNDILK